MTVFLPKKEVGRFDVTVNNAMVVEKIDGSTTPKRYLSQQLLVTLHLHLSK